MKYDDASWHYGGEFPKNSPEEYGGTHIALFLIWCFRKGWAGAFHLEMEPDAFRQVIDGSMSATEFLFEFCDGKLTDEDLSEVGNAFAAGYYGGGGLYLEDYSQLFGHLMYQAPESEHDFETLCAVLDARLREA